jgi:hypothetical protein
MAVTASATATAMIRTAKAKSMPVRLGRAGRARITWKG